MDYLAFDKSRGSDPSDLLRYRESIFAPDLLIAAAGWLDLFNWLDENPSDMDGVCESLGLSPRPVDVMLTLLAALGLVERGGRALRLTALAREFLLEGSPRDLTPYLSSLRNRPVCREMLEVLRTGKPASWGAEEGGDEWASAMEGREFARSFTAAMDSRGALLAPLLAAEMDCSDSGGLLDIAGGSGIYACAIAAAQPHLRAAVLEKPPVDGEARSAVESRGMSRRVEVVAGDMFAEEFPEGYDVHLYSHVLHDWDPPAVLGLLESSHRALPQGGMVAVFDAHINAAKDGPLPVAEYSVLLMFSTLGKCYSTGEMEGLLSRAGFGGFGCVPVAAHRSLITAIKS